MNIHQNILLIIILISLSYEKFTELDFLKTDDTQIKNNYGKGNCVYLRGTNIGNLFVQESWMSSTDAKDQKTINQVLKERFGEEGLNSLLEHYENAYLTNEDFNNYKELGMSVIRVPFTYMNFYEKNGNEWHLKSNIGL